MSDQSFIDKYGHTSIVILNVVLLGVYNILYGIGWIPFENAVVTMLVFLAVIVVFTNE